MVNTIREEIHDLFRHNLIDKEQVRMLTASMTDWQIDAIKCFMDKGNGTLKLTEAQIFTTSRFGFSKRYPQEQRDMADLIARRYVEKFEGTTAGHNRYRLTNLGLVVLYYVADDLPTPVSPTEIDWSQFTSEKDWEKIVKLIGPPRPDRELPHYSVLKLIPVHYDACELFDTDPELAKAAEYAISGDWLNDQDEDE